LHDSELIEETAFSSIVHDCDELLKLLGSITKTLKEKIRNSQFLIPQGMNNE